VKGFNNEEKPLPNIATEEENKNTKSFLGKKEETSALKPGKKKGEGLKQLTPVRGKKGERNLVNDRVPSQGKKEDWTWTKRQKHGMHRL